MIRQSSQKAVITLDDPAWIAAINEKGKTQELGSEGTSSNPTTFDYPDLETAPVISDE